jgi:hypothetical protein
MYMYEETELCYNNTNNYASGYKHITWTLFCCPQLRLQMHSEMYQDAVPSPFGVVVGQNVESCGPNPQAQLLQCPQGLQEQIPLGSAGTNATDHFLEE